MPRFDDDKMVSMSISGGSGLKFSATKVEKLTAMQYTLVTLVCDITGSVGGFEAELSKCLKEAVRSCNKCPLPENLLVRLTMFNTKIDEKHGFKLLADINVDGGDYDITDKMCGGMTALWDATFEAIGATDNYARYLDADDYKVNSLIVVITDGENNASHIADPLTIKSRMESIRRNEHLESIQVTVVGINAATCSAALNSFVAKAGLTNYIDAGDVTDKKLAKLAQWISKSVSSVSKSLGTGTSQPLTF